MVVRQVHRAVQPRCQPEGAWRGPLGPLGQGARADGVVVLFRPLGALADRLEPSGGIGEVRRERGEHRRDLVAAGGVVVDADRHRAHGDQRVLGQRVVQLEVAAQGGRADLEHHVVHLDAECLFDLLGLVERQPGERDGAVGSDRVVERRAGRRERHGAVLRAVIEDVADQRRGGSDRASQQRHHAAGTPQLRHRRIGQQLDLVGHALGLELGLGRRLGVGRQVVQRGHQVGAAGTVDRRVVHLDHQTDAVVLEPLDDPGLPQRLAAIERHRGDLGGDLCQLSSSTRRRAGDPTHVTVELEVGILDPDRVVELERHFDEPSAERRHDLQPVRHVLLEPVERVAVAHRGHVVDADERDLHVARSGLEVEERGVHARQPFHSALPWSPVLPAPGHSSRSDRDVMPTGTSSSERQTGCRRGAGGTDS